MTHGISRFGPEPKHFNSKSLQPHTANFRTIGNYAAHTETITVRIPFNFLTFHSQINNDPVTICPAPTNPQFFSKVHYYSRSGLQRSTGNRFNGIFFNTLSTSDLQDCVHLGDTFFCKGRRELRTDTEQECLTSLYFGAMDHIRRNCGFKIAQAREQIFEVQENTWLIFSMGPMVTNQVCKKKKMTPIKINSGNPPAYKPTAPQTFNVVY